MKKKILILILIVAGGVGLAYSYMNNGNSKFKQEKVQKTMQEYVEKTYKGKDFTVGDIEYETYAGNTIRYHTGIAKSKKEKLYFELELYGDGKIVDEYKYREGVLPDFEFMGVYKNKILDEIKLSKDKITLEEEISINILSNVIQEKAKNKEICLEDIRKCSEEFIVDVGINLESNENTSDDEVIVLAQKLSKYFLDNQYRGVLGIEINYNEENTQKSIFISKNNLNMNAENIKNLMESQSYRIELNEKGGFIISEK